MTTAPRELLHRDVVHCCLEHLSKLASIVLECADAFPYHSCPRRTVTTGNFKLLGLELSDLEDMLGFPSGWFPDVSEDMPESEICHIVGGQFDSVNFEEIRRIADYRPEDSVPLSDINNVIAKGMVNALEARNS